MPTVPHRDEFSETADKIVTEKPATYLSLILINGQSGIKYY